MLAVSKYDRPFVDDCRARMDAQLAAYDALVAGAPKKAVAVFEPQFCNHLVLVIDDYFLHRTRTIEGKDGNPLNEVRMLCTSILHHDNVFSPDKTIKYKAESSVLKLEFGDEIHLDRAAFESLFRAYFEELERKFV